MTPGRRRARSACGGRGRGVPRQHPHPVPRRAPAPPHLRGLRHRDDPRRSDVELVLIDNGSSDPETLTLVEQLADRPDVQVLRRRTAVQLGGSQQRRRPGRRGGDVLVFLNNDIEAHRVGLAVRAVRAGAAARRRRSRGPAPLPRSPPAALRPRRRPHGCGRAPARPACPRTPAGLPAHGDGRRASARPSPARASPHGGRSSTRSTASTRRSGSTSTTSTTASGPASRACGRCTSRRPS